MSLKRLSLKKRTGSEPFSIRGRATAFTVLDFWQWSTSDLVSNATRGCLAEFIVAKALKISTNSVNSVRDEWAAYDLITPDGIKVEVKSAAYMQSWDQNRPSRISFSIRQARTWDSETNRLSAKASWSADVYVFAFLAHLDKPSIDPLNLDQWKFYVLSTQALSERTRSEQSIALSSLERLNAGPFSYDELEKAVVIACNASNQSA